MTQERISLAILGGNSDFTNKVIEALSGLTKDNPLVVQETASKATQLFTSAFRSTLSGVDILVVDSLYGTKNNNIGSNQYDPAIGVIADLKEGPISVLFVNTPSSDLVEYMYCKGFDWIWPSRSDFSGLETTVRQLIKLRGKFPDRPLNIYEKAARLGLRVISK